MYQYELEKTSRNAKQPGWMRCVAKVGAMLLETLANVTRYVVMMPLRDSVMLALAAYAFAPWLRPLGAKQSGRFIWRY